MLALRGKQRRQPLLLPWTGSSKRHPGCSAMRHPRCALPGRVTAPTTTLGASPILSLSAATAPSASQHALHESPVQDVPGHHQHHRPACQLMRSTSKGSVNLLDDAAYLHAILDRFEPLRESIGEAARAMLLVVLSAVPCCLTWVGRRGHSRDTADRRRSCGAHPRPPRVPVRVRSGA